MFAFAFDASIVCAGINTAWQGPTIGDLCFSWMCWFVFKSNIETALLRPKFFVYPPNVQTSCICGMNTVPNKNNAWSNRIFFDLVHM